MRPPTSDPTAGKRARAIHAHPEIPQPVQDPTDPGYGSGSSEGRWRQLDPRRVFDPTDPTCGARST